MKIVIDVPTFIELNAAIADWFVEEIVIDPWGEGLILYGDPEGVYTYTDEAQEVFNYIYGEIEEILSEIFIKEGE